MINWKIKTKRLPQIKEKIYKQTQTTINYKKLQILDSSLFISQSYLNNDGGQFYLRFQTIYQTTTFSGLSNIISEWESKGLLNEKFRSLYTINKIISPKLRWNKSRLRLRFEGSCLKQEDTTPITPNNVVNLFIVCELDTWSQDLNVDFTLKYWLIESVKITKIADTDKYSHSEYGIEFDSWSLFSIPSFDWGKNIVVFGVYTSSSVHIDNKVKDNVILGKGPTQRLNCTTFRAEVEYSINFLRSQRKVFIIMGATVFYLLMLQKYIISKQKILK